ncbi:AAA family ATPase [Microbacterium thalassium]|uniref:MinD-like ATPase involved in chromosome partitioning or flagellar assembly n=1 Tax=Microbacterium thalassium TaxID=362649 RepID=A0A7X0FN11_9MICO|nr:ParA family protein [Microbacterium thalassium]MBB6389977.1 MinD-like ATPase involved in chromosome partitioning or flagellar assembly [Microbacterium thalassium]GLK24663.1 hypothetical protein GCM10017607_19810 [Microbacterium thalassium]
MTPTATTLRAYATVTGNAATFVAVDGRREPVLPDTGEDIRQAIVRRAHQEARRTGARVVLYTSGDRGEHRLVVGADGTLDAVGDPAEPQIHTVTVEPPADDRPARELRGEEVREQAPQTGAARAPAAPAAESGRARPTFLTPARGDQPTARGVFGRLRKPSARERAHAEHVAIVSRHWAGWRTVAVANGKGGVGKTMTTAMLAAVYAREGGGNVLAWDNNDTRGTLGWRTEQGLYDTTVRDLLPAAGRLLAPTAGIADISQFVHHQSADRYDVLRSNPELLATDQRIATAEFDRLMQVAARYYRLVIFDSGNDESAERWLRMIDMSYQLVIPTIATPESAESAALLLDALRARDPRSRLLADNAVVIVTESEPSAAMTAQQIAAGFSGHVRAVRIVPYDPALKSGPLRFDALRPATRDAWVAAAASAAKQLGGDAT